MSILFAAKRKDVTEELLAGLAFAICPFRLGLAGDDVVGQYRRVAVLTSAAGSFRKKHQAFLAGKIDVTAFMTWFVETYPESLARMREDPGYAGRFV